MVKTRRHGEMTRIGDEYNRDDFYYCAVCRCSHPRSYSRCKGLLVPRPHIWYKSGKWFCETPGRVGSRVLGQTPTAETYYVGYTAAHAYKNWASRVDSTYWRK